MPYIPQESRTALIYDTAWPETVGELNWAITSLIDEYINQKGVSYAVLNSAIGVLECAKLELYRRIAAPYEDKKLQENGEVYTCVTI
jgi:hypothetical protein